MAESIQCWQCGTRMTLDELSSNDGDCPECEVEVHLADYLSEALEANQRLAAELAELKAKSSGVLLPPLGDSLRSILGRPNFACYQMANWLRATGNFIPRKSEEEQAAVIYWLLNLYLKHGEEWSTHANALLAAAPSKESEV